MLVVVVVVVVRVLLEVVVAAAFKTASNSRRLYSVSTESLLKTLSEESKHSK